MKTGTKYTGDNMNAVSRYTKTYSNSQIEYYSENSIVKVPKLIELFDS